MRLNSSKITLSNKDIKQNIKFPKTLTKNLSYLMGIHIGDGSMNYYEKGNYLISYTGHLIDEEEFHLKEIKPLIESLFNKRPHIIKDKRDTSIKIYFRSKSIFEFFNKVMNIPSGPKKNIKIHLPILNSSNKIKINFLKGLVDTDFSLAFKKRHKKIHYYPTISCGTPNKILIKQVYSLFLELGFKPFVGFDYKTKRRNKQLIVNQIELNGSKNLEKWMKLIGFKSTKHLTKYQVWKKYGFCPSGTNIIDRYKILNGEVDINSFYTSKHL